MSSKVLVSFQLRLKNTLKPLFPVSRENADLSDETKQAEAADLEAGLQNLDRCGSPPTSRSPPPPLPLNAIAKNFQDLGLGNVMMVIVMAIVGSFLTQHAPTSLVLRVLILSCASLGFSALWVGMMLRSHRYAVMAEQLGAAMVLLALFGLISSLLPGYYQWAPWGCFLLTLFPFYLQLFS